MDTRAPARDMHPGTWQKEEPWCTRLRARGGPGAAAGQARERVEPHQFGLTVAMALIVGSIIGVGFSPADVAAGIRADHACIDGATTVGALALALLFAGLSRRLPADGEPYAYARLAFAPG